MYYMRVGFLEHIGLKISLYTNVLERAFFFPIRYCCYQESCNNKFLLSVK